MRRRINPSSQTPIARRGDGLPTRTGLAAESYWTRSMRPFHVLAFLLPLLVAYELGSIFYLTDAAAGVHRTVEARRVMDDFFAVFGIVGYLVPGFAMATVLLVWHIISRDRWVLDFKTLGGMLAESVAWTLPLLVMAATIEHARGAVMEPGTRTLAWLFPLAAQGGEQIQGLSLGARLTLAVGAGLYEEMLFRLVGLALLHFILADLIGVPKTWSSALAVLLAAVAFAVYHQPAMSDWPRITFYVLSGIYFGTVYALRGFGIVVGTHAMYDVLVLTVLGSH